jgi:hypothetical protein
MMGVWIREQENGRKGEVVIREKEMRTDERNKGRIEDKFLIVMG